MKTISVRIADQDVASVADVNAVRKVRHVVRSDASQILSFLVKNDHAVSFEVANKKLFP